MIVLRVPAANHIVANRQIVRVDGAADSPFSFRGPVRPTTRTTKLPPLSEIGADHEDYDDAFVD